MFENIKKNIPALRGLYCENQKIMEFLKDSEYENQILAEQIINQRLKDKLEHNEKINVLFVCHRPAIWSSLQSVLETMSEDKVFDIKVVSIPVKKSNIKGKKTDDIYESEGAEEFFKKYDSINGYDYNTNKWLDIKDLNPDYVFFQQPYNTTRPFYYKSWVVSKYAKICYVPYAFDFIGGGVLEETTPFDFFKNVSFYFSQNAVDDVLVNKVFQKQNNYYPKTIQSGFPRYDIIQRFHNLESPVWNYARKRGKYRVLWTPRWCINEGNCSFFDYIKDFFDFIPANSCIDFVFRPHPQAFSYWLSSKLLSETDISFIKEKFNETENMSIDVRGEYFDTIFSSDFLISDTSSFMADYFLSGKPIIYCHKKDMFNDISREMSKGFYWVDSWTDLKKTISMLINGEDPLKEKRIEIINELQLYDRNKLASLCIKEYILNDARKC